MDIHPVKANLDAKADLTEAVTETTRTANQGILKLGSLFLGKRMAEVDRHKILLEAQTTVDRERILTGQVEYRDNQLVEVTSQRNLENAILEVEANEEFENLKSNTRKAIEVMEGIPDDEISDEEVSSDFFARWRREAKIIGEEELQAIWGRILTEEVKRPRSISFRTLDVVRNLRKEEAELFQKAARLIVNGIDLVGPDTSKKMPGVSYEDVIVLADCGLLNSITPLNLTSQWRLPTENKEQYFIFKNYLLVNHNTDSQVSLRVLPLSSAGRELSRLIEVDELSKEDYEFIISQCNAKDKESIKMYLKDGGKIHLNNPDF